MHSFDGGASLIPSLFDSFHLDHRGFIADRLPFDVLWTIWFSDAGLDQERQIPLLIILPAVFLLGSISAFLYANLVYTPEIIENAERIRQEIREEEIQKLCQVVQQHVMEGKDLEELRQPLEFALDMTIEDYVSSVTESIQDSSSIHDDDTDSGSAPYRYSVSADAKLATILASLVPDKDNTTGNSER